MAMFEKRGGARDVPTVTLQKFDFLTMAPREWLTSNVLDAAAFIFNKREEEEPGQIRKFWFHTIPYVCFIYFHLFLVAYQFIYG